MLLLRRASSPTYFSDCCTRRASAIVVHSRTSTSSSASSSGAAAGTLGIHVFRCPVRASQRCFQICALFDLNGEENSQSPVFLDLLTSMRNRCIFFCRLRPFRRTPLALLRRLPSASRRAGEIFTVLMFLFPKISPSSIHAGPWNFYLICFTF